jgi:hypothetical protein
MKIMVQAAMFAETLPHRDPAQSSPIFCVECQGCQYRPGHFRSRHCAASHPCRMLEQLKLISMFGGLLAGHLPRQR